MYDVKYLPADLTDMVGIVRYVSVQLQNPTAADHLAEELVNAVERLREFPYSFPVYVPIRPLKKEYRKLPAQNYLIFYWVEEEKKQITIARVIYAKRNYSQFLK